MHMPQLGRLTSITPAALPSGTTHSWGPVDATNGDSFGVVDVIRVTTNAAGSTLGSLKAQSDGAFLLIENIGPVGSLDVLHEQGPTPAERFTLPGGVTLTLPVGASLMLRYDGISQRYRPNATGPFNAAVPGSFSVGGTATIKDLDLVANADPAVGPEMDYAGFRGRWLIGVDVANAPTSRDFVVAGQRGTYSFNDGATTNGSPTLTSASGGGFTSAIVGAAISGSGIPPGTTVQAVGGPTSLTMSANATATASGVEVTITRNTVNDIIYLKHRGALVPTIGLGVTPPDGSARVQISPQDDEPAMQGLRVRVGPTQTGKALVLHDSVPTEKWWVDKDFWMSGSNSSGGAIAINADPTNQRALGLSNNAKTALYDFRFPGGNVMRVVYTTGAINILDFESDGGLRHVSTKLGFFAATSTTKPTVTGSRGGNAALASLLTALATLGLITDSSTA